MHEEHSIHFEFGRSGMRHVMVGSSVVRRVAIWALAIVDTRMYKLLNACSGPTRSIPTCIMNGILFYSSSSKTVAPDSRESDLDSFSLALAFGF